MKKFMLFFVLLGLCFAWSCRPKEIINPSLVVNENSALLKSISIKGATEVKIDNDLGIIQVTLPESYNSDFIDLNFTLTKGAFLNYYDLERNPKNISNINSPENLIYRFTYAGIRPLDIWVHEEAGRNSKSYSIYVKQINKKLQAEVEKIDSVHTSAFGNITYKSLANFNIKITTSNGTFPNNANPKNNFILLKTDSKADTIFLGNGLNQVYFDVERFIPFEDRKFSLELISDGYTQVLNENFSLIREKPQAYFNQFGIFETARAYKISGGIFLPNNQYKVRFSSDLIKNNIILDARFDNFHNLTISSLSSLPIGGYIVEILENGVILAKGVINVGTTVNASAIRAFKKDDNNSSGQWASTKKKQFNQGETFSILPEHFFSSCYGSLKISQEEFDNVEAASLKLTSGLQEIIISPKKIIISVPVPCNVVYFQYTIPKSIESGFYEAQLVYPDGRESLKYWNKIEIK